MSETAVRDAPSPIEVASFLRRHPEFLSEYPDIALSLMVPRDQGATTSLASYQLESLRDKNRDMTRRLHELIEIAAENEQLMVRVHSLSLALMRERNLADSVRRAVAALREDFRSNHVRLVLFRAASAELPASDWLILAAGGAGELPAFAEFLNKGEPLCGRLLPEKLEFLFGAHAGEVRSSVLVPVDGVGMLAIGSEDANRFHPGMGTVFVRLIAESIGAAIARFATQ